MVSFIFQKRSWEYLQTGTVVQISHRYGKFGKSWTQKLLRGYVSSQEGLYLQLRYQIHTSVKFSMFLVWQNFVGKKNKEFFLGKKENIYIYHGHLGVSGYPLWSFSGTILDNTGINGDIISISGVALLKEFCETL